MKRHGHVGTVIQQGMYLVAARIQPGDKPCSCMLSFSLPLTRFNPEHLVQAVDLSAQFACAVVSYISLMPPEGQNTCASHMGYC